MTREQRIASVTAILNRSILPGRIIDRLAAEIVDTLDGTGHCCNVVRQHVDDNPSDHLFCVKEPCPLCEALQIAGITE